jgi:hypothetical protein
VIRTVNLVGTSSGPPDEQAFLWVPLLLPGASDLLYRRLDGRALGSGGGDAAFPAAALRRASRLGVGRLKRLFTAT